ncbi:coat protein [Soybean chlorotic blotch virus]|uniref:Capsid protein n=1 Tax=Soybean chlorotic blotch virus TaxID=761702 RepID=D6MTW6_9GEMI|nr:coat protein [Soybean chlorotic blotch virus]ADG36415.1 coat protein [Soybean chlorotic blotch virus]
MKRNADIVISTPLSKVRRRLNFDSPRAMPTAIPRTNKKRAWENRPMYRKPMMYRMWRSPDVPFGCEGPCKVQSYDAKHDVSHTGTVLCCSDITRGSGLTHRVGKRFTIKSILLMGKIWMDDNIKLKNHTNIVTFFLVRDRRPSDKPYSFGSVFNMFDNEPTTATVKQDNRDRSQVIRKFHATVTGGQYASKEQALVKKFFKINHKVVYNNQEGAEYKNHQENALLLYMACSHASNPVYATIKARVYFYDSVTN